MPAPPTFRDISGRFEDLRTTRANWEGSWREIGAFVMPRRLDYERGASGTGTPSTRGEFLTRRIFDPTASFAAEQLASFLGTQLINPQEDWVELRFRDENLTDDHAAAIWLRQVKRLIMAELNSPDSSFHTSMAEFFLELVTFGTAHLSVVESAAGRPVFVARPLTEMYIAENSDGDVDTHYRKFDWTPRQIKQFFGEAALPEPLASLFSRMPAGEQLTKTMPLLHAVFPREDYDGSRRDPLNMPWASIWLCFEPSCVIRESGFHENPFVTSRWSKTPGDTYGRSPAFTVMPDIRMLQTMSKVVISAAMYRAKKAVLIPDDGFIGGGAFDNLRPGGVIPYRATGRPDMIAPLDLADEPGIGIELIQNRQENVLRAFFVDVIRGISLRGDASPLKATEVIERRNEALQALVPPLTRVQREALAPTVGDRVYPMMARNGLLPPPPEHLVNADFDVEFVAPAVLAARVGEAEKMVRALSQVALMAELDPVIIENIDRDAWTRRILALNGVSPDLLTPEGTAADVREQNQAKQEAAMMVAGGAEVAKAAGALR